MKPILITGATGNVGGQIVKQLHEQGFPVRAAVISEADAANLPAPVEWRIFDFTDPATYGPAFENVETMFLMRPPHISDIDRDMKPAMQLRRHAWRQTYGLSLLAGGRRKTKSCPTPKSRSCC